MTDALQTPKLELNSGYKIPALGFGTWQLAEGDECYNAVKFALEIGYRHIDTAKIYGNEASVGQAIADSGVPREDIFVTTKLWDSDQGRVTESFGDSLDRLNLDYVDLYLIHWPAPPRIQSWKVMEGLVSEDRVKSIGVSNFTVRHLKELLAVSKVTPAVNQVEMHPFLYQRELIDFCQQQGIAIEAYSPLTRAKKFSHHTIENLAQTYSKSPAQIMLRWSLQHGLIPLPKASSQEHIADNLAVLGWELDPHDMLLLDNLHEGFRITKDPETMP